MVLEIQCTNYGRLNDDGSITPTDEPYMIMEHVFDFDINFTIGVGVKNARKDGYE